MSNRTINPVTKLLLEGRERIKDKENWRKGVYHDRGQYCVLGSLGMRTTADIAGALSTSPLYGAVECLYESLPTTKKSDRWTHFANVYDYNDNPRTKHSEIIELMDRAIEFSLKEKANV